MSMLSVDNLTVSYADSAKPAVNSLGVILDRGQSLGIVGESGSGKNANGAGDHGSVAGECEN